MRRVLVVLPLYGGSLPVGRYCVSALRENGCLVEVFEAPRFHEAYRAIDTLKVNMARRDYLENSFLQLMTQAILAVVDRFEPDLVLTMAQAPLSRLGLSKLRKDGVATAMWFVEDHRLFTYWRRFAPDYDVFAVIQKEPFLGNLREAGVRNALYLPLAADPAVHRPLDLDEEDKARFGSPLSFIGAGYGNRRAAFRQLAGKGLKIWGNDWGDDEVLRSMLQMNGQRIATEDTVKIFNAAEINLNLHSSMQPDPPVSHGDFVNPRTFEIAACGKFQLVDTRSLLGELFDPDEMATFTDMDEMQDKIAYFAARPDERQSFALRGQRRVLAEHSYTARMKTLLEYVAARTSAFGRKRVVDWPEGVSDEMRRELAALYEAFGLPSTAGFGDAVAAIRSKSGRLSPTETAILFLDEWKKQYSL